MTKQETGRFRGPRRNAVARRLQRRYYGSPAPIGARGGGRDRRGRGPRRRGPGTRGQPGDHAAAASGAGALQLSLLGQALAFDKELSGNRDISCMTCHLTSRATVDGRSLAIGQGATGLGLNRVHPQSKFVHRSAPALFNLHAMNMLTWTACVRVPHRRHPRTRVHLGRPAAVFECGATSALPMFPVLSRVEMRATPATSSLRFRTSAIRGCGSP